MFDIGARGFMLHMQMDHLEYSMYLNYHLRAYRMPNAER